MTNVSQMRRALEDLASGQNPALTAQHVRTISNGLESLGKRINDLERRVAALEGTIPVSPNPTAGTAINEAR